MTTRNKSVTELVHDERERARQEGIRDAQIWRNHWKSRQIANEERLQDEGDMLARPVMNWRVFLRAAAFALGVYLLLTAALVLIG
jgi:hypothetical protein